MITNDQAPNQYPEEPPFPDARMSAAANRGVLLNVLRLMSLGSLGWRLRLARGALLEGTDRPYSAGLRTIHVDRVAQPAMSRVEDQWPRVHDPCES